MDCDINSSSSSSDTEDEKREEEEELTNQLVLAAASRRSAASVGSTKPEWRGGALNISNNHGSGGNGGGDSNGGGSAGWGGRAGGWLEQRNRRVIEDNAITLLLYRNREEMLGVSKGLVLTVLSMLFSDGSIARRYTFDTWLKLACYIEEDFWVNAESLHKQSGQIRRILRVLLILLFSKPRIEIYGEVLYLLNEDSFDLLPPQSVLWKGINEGRYGRNPTEAGGITIDLPVYRVTGIDTTIPCCSIAWSVVETLKYFFPIGVEDMLSGKILYKDFCFKTDFATCFEERRAHIVTCFIDHCIGGGSSGGGSSNSSSSSRSSSGGGSGGTNSKTDGVSSSSRNENNYTDGGDNVELLGGIRTEIMRLLSCIINDSSKVSYPDHVNDICKVFLGKSGEHSPCQDLAAFAYSPFSSYMLTPAATTTTTASVTAIGAASAVRWGVGGRMSSAAATVPPPRTRTRGEVEMLTSLPF